MLTRSVPTNRPIGIVSCGPNNRKACTRQLKQGIFFYKKQPFLYETTKNVNIVFQESTKTIIYVRTFGNIVLKNGWKKVNLRPTSTTIIIKAYQGTSWCFGKIQNISEKRVKQT